MIVADDGEDAAMRGGSCGIGMLEHVHGAVKTRPLAIPDAEHAIDIGTRPHADMLRTPDGGGAQLFIDARDEDDVALGEHLLGAPQFLIIGAERRAAIP